MIPFNSTFVSGREKEYISQALTSGHLAGDGPFTKQCHELLERDHLVSRALLTTSCTHALEMVALLLNLNANDEVIVPSFTFVSTANAFALRGARIVFVDIRPDTLNINERLLEAAITERTRAVVVVHYAGVGCEMEAILDVANRHGIEVIEDNAHGLFGAFRGRALGTFGSFATLSFHETKNFTGGEGGALLINAPSAMARAEVIREKGTDRSRFFRGQVDKYSWIDVGSSYLPSELVAAHLAAQLESRQEIQSRRRNIWLRYEAALRDWAAANGVSLPHVPAHCDQTFHMFYLVMPSLDIRQRFIAYLRERDIHAVFHYLPLHSSEMGRRYGEFHCPVTVAVSDRLVRLPFFTGLSESDQSSVVDAVLTFKF